jgi:hypothetical protein
MGVKSISWSRLAQLDVEKTAPYQHDGRIATSQAVANTASIRARGGEEPRLVRVPGMS